MPGMPPPPDDTDDDEEWRKMTLAEGVSITGSTGLPRTAYAGSAAPGTFRVNFLMDWWTGGFLCGADTPCNPGNFTEDEASHVGAFFTLNATPFSFLEAYGQIRTYANPNDQSTPQLLQVLGDTTIGVKAFTPMRIANTLTFGGDLRLLLLNGAGGVGVAGGGTSAEILALASADFRKMKGKGVGAPVRIHFNTGYRIDNSGALVDDVETLRAQRDPQNANNAGRIPISRIERFGLGINRVDFWQLRLGVDVPYRWVQPYVEYSVDIPINRQGYECNVNAPLSPSPGDACLALSDLTDINSGQIGYSAIPSRLSLGARTNPLDGNFRGLSAHLAFDIGLSGTSTFIEEVAPTAPWTLYLGIGYAFDTQEKKPRVERALPPPPPPVQLPPPAQYYVRGKIVEQGSDTGVANAIVTVQGSTEPPVASGGDGSFLSREVPPGPVTLSITAEGYKDGTCTVNVVAPMPAAPPPQLPQLPPGMPQLQQPQQLPPQQPTGPQYTDTQCELEALPKDGGVKGTARSADGQSLMGVTVELVDATGKKHAANTGPDGGFAFATLPLGKATVTAQSNDYMIHTQETTVRPREQTNVTLTLNKRPAKANVRLVGSQIQVLQQIHFELNSATIKGDSFTLLEEIADFMNRNKNIKRVEIQGHTDNSGTREINERLSSDRAAAVRTWLAAPGVDGNRLESKGYGSSRPLAPNVTPANRPRNRRVQVVVLDKD